MASFLQVPYSEEEQAALLKTIDDDLSPLRNAGNKIPLDVQAKLADLGFTELGAWSKVAETSAEVRAMITDVVSRIWDSWETAKIRGKKQK